MSDNHMPWHGPMMAVEWIGRMGKVGDGWRLAGCGLLVGHVVTAEELWPLAMHLEGGDTPYIDAIAMTPSDAAEAEDDLLWWDTPPRLVPLDAGADVVRALALRLGSLQARAEEAGE